MKRKASALIYTLALFACITLCPLIAVASTYMVLWSHVSISHNRESWSYDDAFDTIEACKTAATEALKSRVVSELIQQDGVRRQRLRMMTAEEIKKYQLAHPDEMKQVFTDGQIQRDRLGLIPMLNDGSELANAAPAGWTVKKYTWLTEPTFLAVERNDGLQFHYEWICRPDTIDPRKSDR
jgi:hypothetical protein